MSKISEFVTTYIDDECYLMIPLNTKKRDVGAIAAEKFCFDVLKMIDAIEGHPHSSAERRKLIDSIEKIKKRIERVVL